MSGRLAASDRQPQVFALVAEVFGLDSAVVSAQLSADQVERWDSLHHLELLLRIEEAFQLEIPPEMIPRLVSVAAILTFLEATPV